jgi:hypothetical protein
MRLHPKEMTMSLLQLQLAALQPAGQPVVATFLHLCATAGLASACLVPVAQVEAV